MDNDLTQTFTPLTKGLEIGQYKIVEKIGAGGMGEVFLADDTKLDRKVALKFLPASAATNEEFRARFIREAKAVAKLNHPHVITIYEVSEFKNRPFIAMEFVPGKTLREILKDKRLEISQIIEYSLQICQGLAEAHRAGVVHRDIKTTNIVADKRGRIRILDFGLATITGAEEITKTGSTLGTVAYMSPEQVSGREVDHRSDLFSFGIVLYEMVCGKSPFREESDGATLQAIMQKNPEPVTRHRGETPEQLEQVIGKLLEKNIEIRHQSAEGVIADLKRLQYDSQQTSTGSVRTSKADDKSIVVVPFNNMSSDADNEYFSDGLTEEIITDLSGISDLRVISRNSSMLLKNTKKDIPAIGKELNVHYVLTGSVRKAGNNVRITSQLVDAITNQQIWADKYKGNLEDIFEIQENVSQAIVSTLRIKLTSGEKEKLAARPIEDIKAYEYYLRARQEIHKWEVPSLRLAEKYMLEALSIAGDNALIFSGLALVYYQLVNMGAEQEDFLEKSTEYADKSIELDENIADSYFVKGLISQSIIEGFDEEEALKLFEKAIELDPNHADAITFSSVELAMRGQLVKARRLAEKAFNDDPLKLRGKTSIGWVEMMSGNFDKMLEIRIELYKDNPNSPWLTMAMVHIYSYVGNTEEAGKLVVKLTGDNFYEKMARQMYYGVIGEKEKALQMFDEKSLISSKRDAQYSLFTAWGYVACGEYDQAIDWLENSVARGFANYPFLLEFDLMMKPLRSLPRFKALMIPLKKKWEYYQSKSL